MITVRRITRGSTSIGIILDNVPDSHPSDDLAHLASEAIGEPLGRFHFWGVQRFSLEPGAALVTLYKD